ncbi:MAG: FG-GAP repeat protein [Candidatus Eisenbacteria bacterium]|nr:FG-GAP repeat protein [Candidatus Eisenbacteria bacterium]
MKTPRFVPRDWLRCAIVSTLAAAWLISIAAAATNAQVPSATPTEGVSLICDASQSARPAPARDVGDTPMWHTTGTAAGDYFGISVATAGDVNGDGYSDFIVGARDYTNSQTDEGAAFLYLGSADGLVTEPAWVMEGNQSGAHFGVCVAPAGDVNADGYDDVIIGADIYDSGQFDEGCAFVYLGSAAGLSTTPVWMGQGDQASAQYGFCVATAGDVNGDGYADILVSTPFYDNGQTNEGKAFLYYGGVAGIQPGLAWSYESNQASAYFGRSAATAGDVNGDGYADIIIGADRYDGSTTDCGRAWVFYGSAAGIQIGIMWTDDGTLTGDHFGWSVAPAGDTDGDGYADILIGAPDADAPGGIVDAGYVYVYRGSAAGLPSDSSWRIHGGVADTHLGYSVAAAGDVNGDSFADVIFGASGWDNGQADEGRARVYQGGADGDFQLAWSYEIDQVDARFGSCVATAGDVDGDGFSDVAVGTWAYDAPGVDAGGAWVFAGAGEDLAWNPSWTQEGEQASEEMGDVVACAGDVNGDGLSDIAFGSPGYDASTTDGGRAWEYDGTPVGPGAAPDWTADGTQSGAYFGDVMANAGDVNGDGYSDLLVAAHLYNDGAVQRAGRVWLYLGSASGLQSDPVWSQTGDRRLMCLGWRCSGAGDVNGDGYADVILGAYGYTDEEAGEGAAFLYLGSPDGLGALPAWTMEGNLEGAHFGISTACAGDVNGDGYSDVIIGAPGDDIPGGGPGRAYVYLGGPAGLALSPAWTGSINQNGDAYGNSVSSAGDMNGDGYDDVIIGAPAFDYLGELIDCGSVRVHLGCASGVEASPHSWTYCSESYAYMGFVVCCAGDVNGDGYSDVAMSGPLFNDTSLIQTGRVWLKLGSSSGWAGWPEWIYGGSQPSEMLGIGLAGAGDTNGDGFDDLIIGARQYSPGGGLEDAGRVLVFLGGNFEAAPWSASTGMRQQEPTNGFPIDLLGKSTGTTAFQIAANAHGAAGRIPVRLEYQAAEIGTDLVPLPIGRGSWRMTGTPAGAQGSRISLVRRVTGLPEGVMCHWRARVATRSPFFPWSPWMSTARTVPSQSQFRTAGAASAIAADDPAGVETGLRLEVLRPNPFLDYASIAYEMPSPAITRVSIHDVTGRCVRTLVDVNEDAGRHVARWDGRDEEGWRVPSGVYLARVQAGSSVRTAKIVRTR